MGFIYLFIFGLACGMELFLGQGSNPRHSSDLHLHKDNTGSLTCCATREPPKCFNQQLFRIYCYPHFYRWWNRGTGRSSDIPKDTQLGSGEAKIQSKSYSVSLLCITNSFQDSNLLYNVSHKPGKRGRRGRASAATVSMLITVFLCLSSYLVHCTSGYLIPEKKRVFH